MIIVMLSGALLPNACYFEPEEHKYKTRIARVNEIFYNKMNPWRKQKRSSFWRANQSKKREYKLNFSVKFLSWLFKYVSLFHSKRACNDFVIFDRFIYVNGKWAHKRDRTCWQLIWKLIVLIFLQSVLFGMRLHRLLLLYAGT